MTTHTVIFDKGDQDVTSIAHRDDGEPFVPATPTYEIVDLRHSDTSTERVIVASGTAATVGAISLAMSAAGPAETDPRIITVASVVGLVEGERFMLDSQTGIRQVVHVDAIPSATTVQLRDPVARNYPATSLIVSVEVVATFPTVEAADDDEVETGGGPYAIDWDFDGVLRREIIWLRRTAERTWSTPDDLRLLDQTLEQEIASAYRFFGFTEQAHRDVVDDLRMAGIDTHRLDSSILRSLETYRAAWQGRVQLGDDKLEKKWDDRYRGMINTLTTGTKPESSVYTDDDDRANEGTSTVLHHPFSLT